MENLRKNSSKYSCRVGRQMKIAENLEKQVVKEDKNFIDKMEKFFFTFFIERKELDFVQIA